jgi:hypothetical protein
MIDSGVLTDYTTSSENLGGDIEAELDKVTMKSSVDEELEKLKSQRMRKKNKGTGQEQQEEEEEAKVTAQ